MAITVTSNTSGLDDFRARLAMLRDEIAPLVVETGQIIGDNVAQKLGDAAPKGRSGGSTIGDDASGPLSESFSADVKEQGDGAVVSVVTSQGIKLGIIVEGRGEILPTVKRALFWEGLDHPVRRAGPAAANDFVSGVIDAVDEIIEPEMEVLVEELNAVLEG